MRHHDDRDAFVVEPLENLHHLDAGPAVEIPGRLVGEDHVRIVDQRSRDGNALLLASGKLARRVIAASLKAHRSQDLFRFLPQLRAGERDLGIKQRQLDVFQGRRAREKIEVLENEPEFAIAHIRQLIPA